MACRANVRLSSLTMLRHCVRPRGASSGTACPGRPDRPGTSCNRWPARPRHKGTCRAGRNLDQAGARPGQGVIDDDPRAGGRHGPGQQIQPAAKLAADDLGLLAGVGPLVVEDLLVFLVGAAIISGLPCRAVQVAQRAAVPRTHVGRGRPKGMLAVEDALLVGLGQRGRKVAGGQPPGAELRVERLDGRFQGTDRVGRLRFDRHREPAVDPGVGHVAADDRQLGLLGKHGAGEIVEGAEMDADARHVLLRISPQIFHVCQRGRTLVVAGHDHGQVVLAGPVFWRRHGGNHTPACNCRGCGSHPGLPTRINAGARKWPLAPLLPICRNFTPAWAKMVGHTQEWQGTSVILAAMGSGRPYLRAIADENRIPRTRSSRSHDSVCRLNGRAWTASALPGPPARCAACGPALVCGPRMCAAGQPGMIQAKRFSGGNCRS